MKSMGLYNNVERILADLAAAGLGPDSPLTVSDLTPFDQYHYEGTVAVDEAAFALGATSGLEVLDVGAGLGGPARYLAETSGAIVTALELQADLDKLGAKLTERCGLAEHVHHVNGDILTDDLGAGRFEGMMSMLCVLHIADRDQLFSRCAHALAPGARIFIEDYYERAPMTEQEKADLAHDVSCPYLPDLETYVSQVANAGFIDIDVTDMTHDWTDFVAERLGAFRSARTELTDRYNPATVASLDRFYATVASLFDGGNLGGIRLTATRAGSNS